MIKNKLLLTLLTLSVMPLVAQTVVAEEITITDNGSGSSNEVTVTSNNQTTVQQDNNASIINNVDTNANTGGNTASGNTGDNTNINTGNVDASVSVQNNLNESSADVNGCCNGGGEAAITGNGAGSTNGINYTSNNTTTANVTNDATLTNNIYGSANTGGNNASNNNGNVWIATGNIKVSETLKNNVNKSHIDLSTGGNGGFVLKISGNGSGSENIITFIENSNNIVNVNNVSDIFNNSIWDLITGNNTASGNNGDVTITTGDIDLSILIENNVNKSKVEVDCDCEEEVPPPPPCVENCGGNPPPPPPGNGGNGGNGGGNGGNGNGGVGGNGEVLGAALGEILPVTGTPWIVLAILGNLLMLLFGLGLRLRSGRSPNFAFAL